MQTAFDGGSLKRIIATLARPVDLILSSLAAMPVDTYLASLSGKWTTSLPP
ncbi:MAG: hypothetical protein HYX92_12060 [Chloroflexi bacterium]|nr:hypothetical protein [Chloroflexota bacterium]